jgi:uncharacterized protein (TIGR03435 family)
MTTPPSISFCAARSFVLPLAIAALSLPLQAQSAASPPATEIQAAAQPPLQFEVISIRAHPSAGDEPSNRRILPGGRFIATATTVRTLIRIAFLTDDDRISGTPGWIDSETFNIDAITVNHTEVTTPQQFQQLILSLLEDRFQFRFHRVQKEGPVYWLELDKPGKTGPALRLSSSGSQPNMSTNSNGSKAAMSVSKMSMVDIATGLRHQAGRPVEDHTGLKGTFDFRIEWAPEESPDSADPSLFAVLREQLGLRLQPAKGTLETIVIDQIARPSAN